MPRARHLLIAVALVAGMTAACADDDGDAEGSSPTTLLGSSTTVAPPQDTPTSGATSTTTTVAPAGDIVLRGDGLGVTDLGDVPRVAVAAVTAALGTPTADTGWESAFGAYGTCPGGQIRGVEWDHLVLLFTDGETAYASSGQHLFSWRITGSPPALGTATGFGYRATAADAQELYPGRSEVVPAAEPFPSFLLIDAEGGPIRAFLDDADTVTNLEAGVACGE